MKDNAFARKTQAPLAIALVYAAFSAIWFTLPASILARLAGTSPLATHPSGLRDGVFLLASAMVALVFLRRRFAATRGEVGLCQAIGRPADGLIEALPDPLLLLDANGAVVGHNSRAQQALAALGPLRGTAFPLLFPECERDEVRRALGQADFAPVTLESWIEMGGLRVPFLWSLSAERDADGHLRGFLASGRDISVRRQAESARAESEHRYRQLVDLSPDLICVLFDQHIAFVNPAGLRLLGAEREEQVLGRPLAAFIHEDYRDALLPSLPQLAAERQSIPLKVLGCDGRSRDAELSAAPLLQNGRSGLMVAMQDVTHRKLTAERLREREERLRDILDTVVDAIIAIDEEGIVQNVNAAAERIFGFDAAELLGQSVNVLIPDPLAPDADGLVLRYIRTKTPEALGTGIEAVARRRDGSLFPVDIAINERRQGRSSLFTGIIRDITERKRSEDRLAVADKVLESTSEGVMVTDPQSRILWVNNAFGTISGFDPADVIGKTPTLLRSGMQTSEFYAEMWRHLTTEGHWEGEIWNRRKAGEAYPEWLTIRAIHDVHGNILRYVGIFSDISKHKHAEETIRHLTYYDPVTRLPNRFLLRDRLARALENTKRNGKMVGVVLIGLNRFRAVNESFGHQVGDALLRKVAERVASCMRTVDTLARLESDRFCCVFPDLEREQNAVVIIERILDSFASSFMLGEHEVFSTASIGISLFPLDGGTIEDLMRNAEIAMHRSKDSGDNAFQFYTSSMNTDNVERVTLETDLRKGIGRDELLLHFQPKVDLITGQIVGAEALVRWQHPRLGMIPPNRFIPLAEETHLMGAIGVWVLRAACEQIRHWEELGLPPLTIAVNLSAQQFRQGDLVQMVKGVIKESGISPARLELELTETDVMADAETAIATMGRLRDAGVQISIDDFGTGYSSLSYLQRFPVDTLKIDQSFIRELSSPTGEAIVAAIIAMAHNLGLTVIAEGVETLPQVRTLKERRCNQIQGYYFSPPLPPDKFAALVKQGKRIDAEAA